jgi:hypothetical protein
LKNVFLKGPSLLLKWRIGEGGGEGIMDQHDTKPTNQPITAPNIILSIKIDQIKPKPFSHPKILTEHATAFGHQLHPLIHLLIPSN